MKSSKTRQIVHPRKRHLTNDHFMIKKRDSTRTFANKHLPKNAFEYRETVFRVITLLQSKPKQKKGEFLSKVLRFFHMAFYKDTRSVIDQSSPHNQLKAFPGYSNIVKKKQRQWIITFLGTVSRSG